METIVKCTCKDCLNNYKGYCTAQKIQLKRNKCVDRLSADKAMKKEYKHGAK